MINKNYFKKLVLFCLPSNYFGWIFSWVGAYEIKNVYTLEEFSEYEINTQLLFFIPWKNLKLQKQSHKSFIYFKVGINNC
jgi:hypothetical protein